MANKTSKARVPRGQGKEQSGQMGTLQFWKCGSHTPSGQKQRWLQGAVKTRKCWANHLGPDHRPALSCEELNLEAVGLPDP